MILTEKVSKFYGEFQALKDVSFEIGKGEIVGFLGRNGAGKTTLMRILTTFFPPTYGKVMIGDKDINKDSLAIRKILGYLPENPPLYPNMQVRSYLKFAAQLKDIPAKSCNSQIDRVISECDLQSVEKKIISTLSKGFKQRIGIAQAIINEPEVLILDEPTSGLDPIQITQVRNLIRKLECQRTVIVSTHILPEIEQLAKRVIIIKQGQIAIDEKLKDLFADKTDLRKVLVKVKGKEENIEKAFKETNSIKQVDITLKEGVYSVKAVITSELNSFNELSQKLIGYEAEILDIREFRPTLEEIFVKVDSGK